MDKRSNTFRRELLDLINKHSKENASDTPDFALAAFLVDSLKAFDNAVNHRTAFYKTERSTK